MGRAPCCDKNQVKRGPWGPEEDLRLMSFIQKHGHENWRALPKQAGLLRCGKSCRLRWINYLRPDVKRGNFTREEEDSIIALHQSLGNKWSKIASHLPGRTDNEIKNVWNTHLKKRLQLTSKYSNHSDINNSPLGGKECSVSSSSSSTHTTFFCSKIRHEPEFRNLDPGHTLSKKEELMEDPRAIESDRPVIQTVEEVRKEPSSPSSSSSISPNLSKTMGLDLDLGLGQVMEPGQEGIPLESDLDFWDMLDSLGCGSCSNSTEAQSREVRASEECIINMRISEEDEDYRRWLRHIESELGLLSDAEQPMANCGSPMPWPCPPPNFAI